MKKTKVLFLSVLLLLSVTLIFNSCETFNEEIFVINEITHIFEEGAIGAIFDHKPHEETGYHYLSYGYGGAFGPPQATWGTEIDLSNHLPAPKNQGSTNSCVGFAFAYHALTAMWHINNPNSLIDDNTTFSPNYLYNKAKEGNDCSGSTRPDRALEILEHQGCANLNTDNFNADSQFPVDCNRSARPVAAQDYAAAHAIESSHNIIFDTKSMKKYLIMGYPIVIGVDIDANMYLLNSTNNTLTSIDYTPDNYPSSVKEGCNKGKSNCIDLGGDGTRDHLLRHVMTVVGYSDTKQAFKVRNSWGDEWGINGDFWLPYSIADESWTKHTNGGLQPTSNENPQNKFILNAWIMEISNHHISTNVTGGYDISLVNVTFNNNQTTTECYFEFELGNKGDATSDANMKYVVTAIEEGRGNAMPILLKEGNAVLSVNGGQSTLLLTDVFATSVLSDGSYEIILKVGSYSNDPADFLSNDLRPQNNKVTIPVHVVGGVAKRTMKSKDPVQ